ncbi:MFS transporter [Modestobacter marinus]|uniref:MFS family permease n=1 Tax=Modestobacter marinus TaxID=477641 RepID=A0A846LUP3_9ACTN|nr:MFS transporter [Modestobacter marinus]NIH67159.1 MFS family permease [Modestobacter marinus]
MTSSRSRVGRQTLLARTGRSLRHPNYRRFISGHAVSVIGTWMQRVAQDWLVLELTGSPVAIGTATALQFLPTLLFGVWGGVLVDRFDRWKLIIGTQVASAVLAAALAVTTLTGATTLGLVYVMATLLGLVTVIDSPARQAFVTDLVPVPDYVNAQALNSTIHNTGRLIGPAVAGLVISTAGAGTAFAVNAVSFLAVLIGLARIDRSALHRTARLARGRGQAREGLRYAWHHRELRACLFLVAVVGVFGQNFRVILPVTATEVLDGDAATYGYLTAALGLGAVLGALGAASSEQVTGRRLLLWTVLFGVVNLAMALAGQLPVALAVLAAVGVANILFNTVARSLLQVHSTPEMQGRVMALHGLLFLGTTPIGAPLLGWICATAGSAVGFLVAGGSALLAAVAAARQLRRSTGSGAAQPSTATAAPDPAPELPATDARPDPRAPLASTPRRLFADRVRRQRPAR